MMPVGHSPKFVSYAVRKEPRSWMEYQVNLITSDVRCCEYRIAYRIDECGARTEYFWICDES